MSIKETKWTPLHYSERLLGVINKKSYHKIDPMIEAATSTPSAPVQVSG